MGSTKAPEGSRFEKLLDGFDRLDSIRQQIERSSGEGSRKRLQQQKSRLVQDFAALLEQGPPRALAQERLTLDGAEPLPVVELVLLTALFHQRLRHDDGALTGRDLLWIVSDSSYELFRNLEILGPASRLIEAGLAVAVAEPEDGDDTLGNEYMISRSCFESICNPSDDADPESVEPAAYADSTDYLLDLGRLVDACQLRAAKIFEVSYWREVYGEPEEPLSLIEKRIDEIRCEIGARRTATPDADLFVLAKFRRELGLTATELIIVVTLLLQEAMAGCPVLDCLDLIRLVSASPRDLLRKRRLMDRRGSLRRHGIIEIEEAHAEKELTGQAYLANWVTERLIDASMRADHQIVSDERIEFHNYLSRLGDSDDFFDKL